MHPVREHYAKEISQKIIASCNALLLDDELAVRSTLGIDAGEVHFVLRKVMEALPDKILYMTREDQSEEMMATVTREFIAFQSQEIYQGKGYEERFCAFIRQLASEIHNRFLNH